MILWVALGGSIGGLLGGLPLQATEAYAPSGRETDLEADLDARLAEGREAARLGELARSETLFRRLVLDHPRSAAARLGLAETLVAGGRRREAHAGLMQAGSSAMDRGEYEVAFDLLEKAVELADGFPTSSPSPTPGKPTGDQGTLALAGRAAVLTERYQAAADWLQVAVAAGEAEWSSWLYLAAARWETGALAEAEAASRQAVETSGGQAIAVHQLGRLLLWSGRFGEAETTLLTVDSPTAPADFLQDLALAQQGQDKLNEARSSFERSVALAPQSVRSRWGLAQVLLRLGERTRAAEELAVYQQLYDADQRQTRQEGLETAARLEAARLLGMGQPSLALAALPGVPWSAETSLLASTIHQRSGDLSRALEVLREAVEAFPERIDLRVRLQELRLNALESGG